MKLYNHRRLYEKDTLSINEIGENPFSFFLKWFQDAENSQEIIESNAMTISTVDQNNSASSIKVEKAKQLIKIQIYVRHFTGLHWKDR